MKKLSIIFVSMVTMFLAGCLKDTPVTDLHNTGTLLEFEYPLGGGGSALGSGLEFFGGGALGFPPTDVSDTVLFMVNLASPNTLSKDVSITIGVDQNALKDNYFRDSLTYDLMPDSLFTILGTTGTIKAGHRLDSFYVVFYPNKVDPTKNFMLPITVTSNSASIGVSQNFGHIYFHTIGNPLAGVYTVTGTRYNYVGSVTWDGVPANIPQTYVSTTDLAAASGGTLLASPDNTHQIEIGFSNLFYPYVYYVLANSDYSSISVDYSFDATYSNFQTVIVSYTPPTPGPPAFRIITHYNNNNTGTGNDRIVDETFVHQ